MKIINEKYLILGSNSFPGSNFINYLLNKKKIVIGISRSNEYNQTFLKYYKNKNIKNYKFLNWILIKTFKKF